MNCKRHPREETALTCVTCEDPICPRCAVSAPVGFKCPACAKQVRTVGDITPALALKCFAVTFGVSLIAAVIESIVPILILAAIAYGWVVGEVAFNSSNRRYAKVVEAIAVICAAGSMLVIQLAPYMDNLVSINWTKALGLTSPFFVIEIVIASVTAFSRIRYR